jgi:Phage tail sheath protein.
MPVTPTYPGVYIQEIPSGVHTIAGVATSIAAFIDFFTQGPMNEATQILSFADFERAFGGLNALSEASYGIQQFFLNGGSEAWVVRAASSDGANVPTAAAVAISDAISGAAALTVTAISAGAWGNRLRASIDTNVPTAGQFNLKISQYQTQGSVSVLVNQEVFRNLSMTATDPNFVETIVNDPNSGSAFARVKANTAARPLGNGLLSGAIGTPATITVPASPTISATIGGASFAAIPFPLAAGTYTLAELAPALANAIRAGLPTNTAFSGAVWIWSALTGSGFLQVREIRLTLSALAGTWRLSWI